MNEITEVLLRWNKGMSLRKIADSLGMSRNTIRELTELATSMGLSIGGSSESLLAVSQRISKERGPVKKKRSRVAQQLSSYEEQFKKWLEEPHMTYRQIQRLLSELSPPVHVKESSLRRHLKKLFPKPKKTTMVLPTIPGHQAQVDFGYVGLMQDPITQKQKRTNAFVMTLSHSRYRFVYFVFRQDTATWVDCHRRAFEFFGGVVETVLLDNLKAGVIKPDAYDPTLNKAYAECERHYGFLADPAKVRTPEHKGKVERSITIVKQQVIAGRNFQDIHEANRYAKEWSETKIAHEITRTTGETPWERFQRDEKPALKPLPDTPFECPVWQEGMVGKDCHVVFNNSFYSAPFQYVEEAVSIRATLTKVEIYHRGICIKTHSRASRKGEWKSEIPDLNDNARHYLENTPEFCMAQAKQIGEATNMVIALLLSRYTNTRLRKAKAILRLAEQYGNLRLEAACARAVQHDNIEYETIRRILENSLDVVVPPSRNTLTTEELTHGTFLRDPGEFMVH